MYIPDNRNDALEYLTESVHYYDLCSGTRTSTDKKHLERLYHKLEEEYAGSSIEEIMLASRRIDEMAAFATYKDGWFQNIDEAVEAEYKSVIDEWVEERATA